MDCQIGEKEYARVPSDLPPEIQNRHKKKKKKHIKGAFLDQFGVTAVNL